MQGTIIPIVIGAFGTVTKGLLEGLQDMEFGGRVETIETTTLLRTARDTEKKSWKLEETCCPSNSCERSSAKTDVKNSNELNNNNNNNNNSWKYEEKSWKKSKNEQKIDPSSRRLYANERFYSQVNP